MLGGRLRPFVTLDPTSMPSKPKRATKGTVGLRNGISPSNVAEFWLPGVADCSRRLEHGGERGLSPPR